METQSYLPSNGGPLPNFRHISIVPKRLDASRCHSVCMEVGLSPGEFVLDGDPAPSTKGGGAPSPILRVEVENFEIDRKCGALPVVANFVALEQ